MTPDTSGAEPSFMVPEDILTFSYVAEAVKRGIITIEGDRVKYALNQEKTYNWTDPEEWVRCHTIAWLTIERDYPAKCMRVEVTIPRRQFSDHADVVVYRDKTCEQPYLILHLSEMIDGHRAEELPDVDSESLLSG